MDIDHGGVQGLVAHEMLDCEKVGTVLIKVGAEGMAEGMAGDAVLPAETLFMARICRMR
jgi:hypothetical protein